MEEHVENSYYFLLRGNNEYLALGELKALLEVYTGGNRVNCFTMLCIARTKSEVVVEIIERSGFLKEAGVVIGVFDAYSEQDARETGRLVGKNPVHVSILKSTISEESVNRFIEVGGIEVGFRGRGEYRLFFTDGRAVLARKLFEKDYGVLLKKARSRPFQRSIALKPDIARALVNLTRAKRGDLLIDPFTGTGTILLEAWDMGVLGLGVEIDYELVVGFKANVLYSKAPIIPVISDSSEIVFREVDRIATDLPYGRGASTHGVEIKKLYESFTQRLQEYLSRNGYACFMTPLWLEDYVDELISQYGFKLTERYYDYVHGQLTRVINVVRKQ